MVPATRHTIFAEPFSSEAIARMSSVGPVTQLDACDEQTLLAAVQSCDALLVRTSSQVTRRVIESAPHLKVIGRGGVGLDNIDLVAAREKGVSVVYTPTAATDAVADLTFAFILSLIWNLKGNDGAVRAGRFLEARTAAAPRELPGMTLGIIGMGRIGRAVARRAVHGFQMNVLFNDIVKPEPALDFVATPVSKIDLYKTSDIVSLHVPLTKETRGLIDSKSLATFKSGTILINAARGAVVNLSDVDAALRRGHLGGAGLDVFDPEPPPPSHPIMHAPNTVFTPHIGAKTALAQSRMNSVVEDVIRVLEGKLPLHENSF